VDQHATAFSGYKAFLRAQAKTKTELLALASDLEAGLEDVTITSIGTEGSSTSGQLGHLPRELKLAAIMEVYQEGNGPRQLCTVLDRSLYPSPL
jgi:hypothetical protein